MTGAPAVPGIVAPETERVSKMTHGTFFLCAVMVVLFAVWASNTTIDIVSMATGEVTPSTQVKTIQHLEGGIIREILVAEGNKVVVGQSIIVLEPTASSADVAELRVRLNSLIGDIAQLEALEAGTELPRFSPEFVKKNPKLVEHATRRFVTRRNRHRDEMKSQQQSIIQRQMESQEISTRISGSRRNLELVEEQIRISDELMKENLTNRFRHLDLLKEVVQLRNAIESDRAGLNRANASQDEAKAVLNNIRSTYQDEIQKSLEEARLSYGELNQRVKKFEDSLQRTVVRSPVDGVVKTLHVVTVGGVLRPGDPVVDIVPGDDSLIIESQLPTQDIGHVAVGQKVVVKLASADAMRYGNLAGIVAGISPDTLITPEGMPFYKVRIEVEHPYFEQGKQRHDLYPGMQVMTNIQTGERTVLTYILDPILYRLGGAIQER
ncbi:MAG: HlyD family type I secretion periplasmic adaptor subunit [Rhodospirillales bacterium]|nr:HlyD family type I secretion periplasmic adaptor subunit [Rhodospirillales bacterium]